MRAGVLCLLAVCGRIGFQAHEDALDASTAVDAPAADADAPCTGPFGPAARLAEVSSPSQEWGGHLSDDGLELYFGSDRAGGGTGMDIFVATRTGRAAPFGAPARIDELATSLDEDNPFLVADGLTLWFDRGGEIFTAVRASRQAAWQPAQPVPALNAGTADVAVALSKDELTVYFSSDRAPGLGGLDLWKATRDSPDAAFGSPTPLTALSTAGFDCCPQLGAREDELLFTTDQLSTGPTIAVAALDPATGEPSGPATISPLVDGPGEEIDVFATRDGTIIGYSWRATPVETFDLFLRARACP